MMDHLQSVLDILSCPDDGHALELNAERLYCKKCSRAFPIHNDGVIELIPSYPATLPTSIGADYRNTYLELFAQPFTRNDNCIAWGAPETASQSWIQKRLRQVATVEPLVTNGIKANAVLCDIAAGAGYYTFAYQK